MKTDVYDKVNDLVIEGLKKKGLTWFKPWTGVDGHVLDPINFTTGKPYRGINVWILGAQMADNGYEHNEWATFKQISKKGGKVVKGQRSTEIVFWNVSYKVDDMYFPNKVKLLQAGYQEHDAKKFFSLKTFRVFNIAQCEGIDPVRKVVKVDPKEFNPIESAVSIVKGYKTSPKVVHRQQRAFYNPASDFINMPKPETFNNPDTYYHTLFHEMVHSTGHKSRLNRATLVDSKGFGTTEYSKEELVAEIGAMYLSGLSGINPDVEQSQAYINGWVSYLTEHKKEVVSAMTQATKAVNHITA